MNIPERTSRPSRHARVPIGLALAVICASSLSAGCSMVEHKQLVRGIIWQPDQATLKPQGDWQKLGAHELLIQWTVLDGQSLLGGASSPPSEDLPDFSWAAKQPWARRAIVGLATNRSEAEARSSIARLVQQSNEVASSTIPLNVCGWYFPVELDPTWTNSTVLRSELEKLPRPLWISVYDNANLGPQALVETIRASVPNDVGLLFQDGVGVFARTPTVARDYLDALRSAFGKRRVRVIAEAFRVGENGFRSATASELTGQLVAYHGYQIYLFDGPHYVNQESINGLLMLNMHPPE